MATVVSNAGCQLHNKLTRSLEKILDEAHLSGELKLSGRKLKDFPVTPEKCDLSDTVIADLSKNRFGELPSEVTKFFSLETLQLYHNTIRSIPDTVVYLQSLTFLDLSRNQLSVLPSALCQLPLEVLLVSNNKLVAIPEEIGRMKTLTELDASCNEIAHLPRQVGDLPLLRALNVRQNHLKQLPFEITYLRLVKLDISENRISTLPNELRTMASLVEFHLSHNPLTSPPAHLCMRGRVHIFKYLEIQAIKDDKRQGLGLASDDNRRTHHRKGGHSSEPRGFTNGRASELRHKRTNVDSGYSTSSDGVDRRWSQEVNGEEEVSNVKGQWARPGSAPIPVDPGGVAAGAHRNGNGNCSGASTPSTISPGDSMNMEEEFGKALNFHGHLERKRLESNSRSESDLNQRITNNNDGIKSANGSLRYPPNNVNKVTNGLPLSPTSDVVMNGNGLMSSQDEKRPPLEHIQTYREYKEALKQQRGQDVYRTRDNSTTSETLRQPDTLANQEVDPSNNYELRNRPDPNSKLYDDGANKRPVQKVPPSRNSSSSVTFQCPPSRVSPPLGSHSNGTARNGTAHDSCYVKPSSPTKSVPSATTGSPKLVTTSVGYVNGTRPQALGVPGAAPRSPKLGARAMMWNREVAPDKLSFTMRREFDKAREEAELIEQLRSLIESRLKMSLPENMAPALMDGVVLCHLANHVRPRSVASIHVPSPAVPKLTMARCRRNVDNFLEACRKIGVDEADLCERDDIVESLSIVPLAWTIEKLFDSAATPTRTVRQPCNEDASSLVSLLCLGFFVGTLVLLYFFPLPSN